MKKNRIALILAVICIILALALSFTITYRIAVLPMEQRMIALQNTIDSMKSQKGLKGDTPVLGVDYEVTDGNTPACYYTPSQCAGNDGNDSVSTNTSTKTIESVIKEQQVIQPYKDIRFNPEARTIETKMSNDTLWETLVPCEMLIVGCPIVAQPIVTPPSELVEL